MRGMQARASLASTPPSSPAPPPQAFIPFIALALAFIGLAFMTFFIAVFIGKAMAGNEKTQSARGREPAGLGAQNVERLGLRMVEGLGSRFLVPTSCQQKGCHKNADRRATRSSWELLD